MEKAESGQFLVLSFLLQESQTTLEGTNTSLLFKKRLVYGRFGSDSSDTICLKDLGNQVFFVKFSQSYQKFLKF